MSIFTFVLLGGLFIFFIFLILLIWQIKSGQVDDLVTPSSRILWEDQKDE